MLILVRKSVSSTFIAIELHHCTWWHGVMTDGGGGDNDIDGDGGIKMTVCESFCGVFFIDYE